MFSRLDTEHDVLVGEDCADGVDTARQGLAEGDDVGLDAVPLRAEHLPGSSETGLDLVNDEENVVLFAQFGAAGEVSVVRDKDTGFALNWLDDEAGDFVSVRFQCCFEVLGVVVPDGAGGSDGTQAGYEPDKGEGVSLYKKQRARSILTARNLPCSRDQYLN